MSSTISSSYSYLQTTSGRINGLASGIDTESIVEKLMKSASAPMELLQQQKQKYEWQRDAFRDVNTQLSTFSTTLFDKYGLQGSFSSKLVNVSDISKVSATASPGAAGTLSLDSVTQLATVASVTKDLTLVKSDISNKSTLGSLGLTDGSVTVSVLQNDGTKKATTIQYKENDTLDVFMSNLNKSGAGVTALFSNGSMSITANATGSISTGAISVTSDSNSSSGNGVFQKLGFISGASGIVADNGKNAIYQVNGLAMESTSNTFNISGYSLTLKESFNTPTTTSPSVTISSSTDVDSMVDKVKEFVKTYNDLITSLNGKVTEGKYRDYSPLTDAQKAGMTQDQITKWEEKAKSGIIRSDSNVRSVLSNLRSIVYNTVDSVNTDYNTLYKIGIDTTDNYQDGGKLVIDEDKLRKALTNDPDSVIKLFTKDDTPDTTNTKINANQDTNPNTGTGVIAQMRKAAQDAVNTIERTSGKTTSADSTYTLGKQLVDINSKIADWKDRLKDIENRYWKQFTAMEDAIQKANSQTSMFTS